MPKLSGYPRLWGEGRGLPGTKARCKVCELPYQIGHYRHHTHSKLHKFRTAAGKRKEEALQRWFLGKSRKRRI